MGGRLTTAFNSSGNTHLPLQVGVINIFLVETSSLLLSPRSWWGFRLELDELARDEVGGWSRNPGCAAGDTVSRWGRVWLRAGERGEEGRGGGGGAAPPSPSPPSPPPSEPFTHGDLTFDTASVLVFFFKLLLLLLEANFDLFQPLFILIHIFIYTLKSSLL